MLILVIWGLGLKVICGRFWSISTIILFCPGTASISLKVGFVQTFKRSRRISSVGGASVGHIGDR